LISWKGRIVERLVPYLLPITHTPTEEAPVTQHFTLFQFLQWTETRTEQCGRRTWVSWASAKTRRPVSMASF